jgi:pyrrolidone-carboxylate peptidase
MEQDPCVLALVMSNVHDERGLSALWAPNTTLNIPVPVPSMVAAAGLEQPSMDLGLMLRAVEIALGVIASERPTAG